MKVAQKIEKKISRVSDGTTFGYQDLSISKEDYVAAAKTMERLINKGLIKRVSPGVFYKPKQSIFGELKPDEDELLKSFLFEDGKRIAYVTGISLYNSMGLTTQIPSRIKIASKSKNINISIGVLKGRSVKSYVDVTQNNFYLLQILDALKDFNKIPDLDIKSGVIILSERLKKFDDKELKMLVKICLLYPPRVRAFLGALLESIGINGGMEKLKNSLNPLSSYKYGIKEDVLPTVLKWNLK